ncbi:MAG: L,D-transpeptidase family protein [Acetobacteraceae bacterium]|nr:L,D-transpeptidase family protein [Acetobacteraceae bacterium]
MNRRQLLLAAGALPLAGAAHAQTAFGPMRATGDAAQRLQARLLRLDEDGLDPRWYDLPPQGVEPAPGQLPRAAMQALADLTQGRGNPSARPDIRRDPAANPLQPWVQQLLESDEPAQVIERAAAATPDAGPLKAALAAARTRAGSGGWQPVPTQGGTLEPWAEDAARVPALRARLSATDPQLAAQPGSGITYDQALQAAVRRFQAAAGLEADGRIGQATFAALNRPASAQVQQLRVALDMRRGVAAQHPSRSVEVNVPDYRLRVMEDGRAILDMAVVVGRPARATPMMVTRLTAVQFNPPWGVPHRLAKEDMLPRLRRDPQALVQRGFRIFQRVDGQMVEVDPLTVNWHAVHPDRFPYVMRQDSGDANALGRIKFVMPNGDDIFLHDTPERRLFNRPDRAHSSGCIRLERPMDLLMMLLETNQGWNRERVDRVLASGATSSVALARVLPIRLHYHTVTVDAGQVRMRQDIYGLDEAYHRSMERGRATPVAARS